MFRNREDAAQRLAARLRGRDFRDPLVLAIPRGGLVIGAVLARKLGAELDVVLTRKLRAPNQPELAIGADTSLNVITESIDRIKMSGSAAKRAFVVETMGRYCGYLTLMGGLAGGAERVYLHEEGISLESLIADVAWLRESFASGRRLFLAMRNEMANDLYTTDFLARLLEQEGQGLYDVRQNILGHLQQGGSPSPFDRLLAVRLVSRALDLLRNR